MENQQHRLHTLMQFAGAVGTSVCAALVAAGSTHGFIFLLILAVVCLILQIVGFKKYEKTEEQ